MCIESPPLTGLPGKVAVLKGGSLTNVYVLKVQTQWQSPASGLGRQPAGNQGT